jgi:ADP-ribose pyrophosphatase
MDIDCKDDRRVLAEGRYLRVLSHNGWEWVERTNCSHAAVVVAVTEQRELVLIEQHRIPLACRVVELPAGLVGDSEHCRDEDLLDAARRELIEETGFDSDRIERLVEGPSSSGLTNEVFTLLLARDARRIGPGGGDDSEDIDVHVVPLDDVPAWLDTKRRAGLMVSPKIYMGLYFVG